MQDFCLVVVLGSGAVGTCTHIYARAPVWKLELQGNTWPHPVQVPMI